MPSCIRRLTPLFTRQRPADTPQRVYIDYPYPKTPLQLVTPFHTRQSDHREYRSSFRVPLKGTVSRQRYPLRLPVPSTCCPRRVT